MCFKSRVKTAKSDVRRRFLCMLQVLSCLNLWFITLMHFHRENTSMTVFFPSFFTGCKTLVTAGQTRPKVAFFTQKLHLCTISALPCVKASRLSLVSAELIWLCLAFVRPCIICLFASACHPGQRAFLALQNLSVSPRKISKCTGKNVTGLMMCVNAADFTPPVLLHGLQTGRETLNCVCMQMKIHAISSEKTSRKECAVFQQSAVFLSVVCLRTHLLMCDFLQVISSPLQPQKSSFKSMSWLLGMKA